MGVTEDSEGNVFDVVGYEDRQVNYEDCEKVSVCWEYNISEPKLIAVDSLGYIYTCSSTNSRVLIKLDPKGNKIWEKSFEEAVIYSIAISVLDHLYISGPGGTGICFETVPEPREIEGETASRCVDLDTQEVYYEYKDIPKIEESEIEILKKQVADLTFMIMQL